MYVCMYVCMYVRVRGGPVTTYFFLGVLAVVPHLGFLVLVLFGCLFACLFVCVLVCLSGGVSGLGEADMQDLFVRRNCAAGPRPTRDPPTTNQRLRPATQTCEPAATHPCATNPRLRPATQTCDPAATHPRPNGEGSATYRRFTRGLVRRPSSAIC